MLKSPTNNASHSVSKKRWPAIKGATMVIVCKFPPGNGSPDILVNVTVSCSKPRDSHHQVPRRRHGSGYQRLPPTCPYDGARRCAACALHLPAEDPSRRRLRRRLGRERAFLSLVPRREDDHCVIT